MRLRLTHVFSLIYMCSNTSKNVRKLSNCIICSSLQNSTAKTINWWCSVRGKELKCSAAVREQNGDFFRNGVPHNHPGDLGSHLKVATTAKVKITNCQCDIETTQLKCISSLFVFSAI